MTVDVFKARIKAHQRRIERYRQLVPMTLSATEREFMTQRITEEKAAIRQLKAELAEARGNSPFGSLPPGQTMPIATRL